MELIKIFLLYLLLIFFILYINYYLSFFKLNKIQNYHPLRYNNHPFRYIDFSKINKNKFISLVTGNVPIIFINVLKTNDIKKLDFYNFCNKFGENIIRIRYGSYGSTEGRKNRKFKFLNLKEYCSIINRGLNEYGGNNSFDKNIFDTLNIRPNCNFMNRFPKGRLWIGPKNSRTPLHKDGPKNLALQVYGKKKWIVYDSKDRSNLCFPKNNNTLEWSNYTIDFYNTCKDSRKAKKYEIILKAGEMLYLPQLWPHDVTNMSKSIMINFWYKNLENLFL